tara:strand:- start:301 stop:480 length:180 start_codon:yes stop_codon:yes gene_type:complete
MIKKYRVSGQWHKFYFANDATHANKLAHEDLSKINVNQLNHAVQKIDELELGLKAVEDN